MRPTRMRKPVRVNQLIEDHIQNPPHPMALTKRTGPRLAPVVKPVTSQPDAAPTTTTTTTTPIAVAGDVPDAAQNGLSNGKACNAEEQESGNALLKIFRPRIHSKRWRRRVVWSRYYCYFPALVHRPTEMSFIFCLNNIRLLIINYASFNEEA